MPLIATEGEQAPCGHWPILRKRGRGDTVASLRFALAEENKPPVTGSDCRLALRAYQTDRALDENGSSPSIPILTIRLGRMRKMCGSNPGPTVSPPVGTMSA